MAGLSHFDEKSGVVPCKTSWGNWAQTIDEVFIEVNVPKGTRGQEIICDIKPKTIRFVLKGQEIFNERHRDVKQAPDG